MAIADIEEQKIFHVPPGRLALIVAVASGIVGLTYLFEGAMSWKEAATYFIYTFFFWQGNASFSCSMDKAFPDLDDMWKRIIASLIFVFFYTAFIVVAVHWIFYDFQKPWKEFFGEYLAGFGITLFIIAIYSAVGFFRMYKKSLLEAESLKRSHIEAELKALTAQVNPHFLFNSLNTLLSLIPEDQRLATQFAKKFSDVYRYILQNRTAEITKIKDEMEFVESYIFLLKARHGDNIHLDAPLTEEDLRQEIPSLTLQMLVENACKHNVISSAKPLRIKIRREGGQLVVKNNINEKQYAEAGTGAGLENIRKRYEYLAKEPIVVEKSDREFTVKLPFIKIEPYELRDHRGRGAGGEKTTQAAG